MQIAWKISDVFSCSTGWWVVWNCWWVGQEGSGYCSGCHCPAASVTRRCWDRRDAPLGHSQMTSSLSLPVAAAAALWGAHKSLATFCSASLHTSPALLPVGLGMLEGLPQPKPFKNSLWTCPIIVVSAFELTDSICLWNLTWQQVSAAGRYLLFRQVLSFICFKLTSYSFNEATQLLDLGILWIIGLHSLFPWPSWSCKCWAYPQWEKHSCPIRIDLKPGLSYSAPFEEWWCSYLSLQGSCSTPVTPGLPLPFPHVSPQMRTPEQHLLLEMCMCQCAKHVAPKLCLFLSIVPDDEQHFAGFLACCCSLSQWLQSTWRSKIFLCCACWFHSPASVMAYHCPARLSTMCTGPHCWLLPILKSDH